MIDDQTVAYVLVAQTCFEDLKQVAGQLAGLLVLGSKPDHPMLLSAEQTYRSAVDGLKSARVSAGARAHHQHLLAAASNLGIAFRELRVKRDALPLLERAYEDLRAASRTLPGFPMISFERGCCA
jgi:hypothetical protein